MVSLDKDTQVTALKEGLGSDGIIWGQSSAVSQNIVDRQHCLSGCPGGSGWRVGGLVVFTRDFSNPICRVAIIGEQPVAVVRMISHVSCILSSEGDRVN